jgi:ABC-2 type transport system ATP-binding protein
MPETAVIETAGLTKTYDGAEALRGLDLAVPPGSICGFLGRNGAGKTTTIKILMGMARPTSGSATVFGLDAASPEKSVEIRSRIGFVSEDKDLYPSLTVEEMVRFTAAFFPSWRRDLEQRYLHQLELPRDRKVRALSKGTRTKLALVLALCRGAELLVLDEPTSGLDPAMAEEVLRAIVGQVADAGTTVFFSSHQIAEVDQIADRIVIVDRGRAAIAGTLDDLRASYRRIQAVFEGDAPAPIFRSPGVVRTRRDGRVLSILASGHFDTVMAEARALGPVSVEAIPVGLKEIFLVTTSQEF